MGNRTQAKIAEILNKEIGEVPRNTDQLTQYLSTIIETLSPLQITRLREETATIRDGYALDLIDAFAWTANDLAMDRETFCKFVRNCQNEELPAGRMLDAEFPKFDPEFQLLKNIPEEPEVMPGSAKSLCLAVESSGFAASVLNISKDLGDWPADQIYECLEVLAGINWPVTAQFWNFVKEQVGSRLQKEGRLQAGAATILMPILDVVDSQMFPAYSDLIIDPISRLGSMPSLDVRSVKKYANLYSEGKGLPQLVEDNQMELKDMLEFASLGNLICGLPKGLVEGVLAANNLIKSDPNLNLAYLLGATVSRCQNQAILNLVASKYVPDEFKASKADWSDSEVANLLRHGVFLAGVDPKQMASWPEAVFREMTPEIVSHMTFKHLGSLTPAQLSAIPVDALAVLAVNADPKTAAVNLQAKTLNHQQFQALVSKRQSLVPMDWLD